MKVSSVLLLLAALIVLVVTTYGVSTLLLSFAFALAATLYWLVTMVVSLMGAALLFGGAIMLWHWMFPEPIDITYIPYEEGEEAA